MIEINLNLGEAPDLQKPVNSHDRRRRLWRLLGGAPETPAIVHATADRPLPGGRVRTLVIGAGTTEVPATLLCPSNPNGGGVLYCHAHGGRYDIGRHELMHGRPALQSPPGPALMRQGYTVLCADMPGFGDRQTDGAESALAKAALWRGDTLLGQMLREQTSALDILRREPAVRQDRIATFGISMGATLAYWLAALDDRIAAAAHLCVFSNIAGLIETGAHDLHGPYMTIPGLLQFGDMADVAALIAPRPQFVGSGLRDPLTPPEALRPALDKLTAAYRDLRAPQALTLICDANSGHAETAAMRAAVLRFLAKTVGSTADRPTDP